MKRREFIAGLTLPLLARAAWAQQPKKVWRIGSLATIPRPASIAGSVFGGFLDGMRDLGYVEERDYTVEWRFAEGRLERVPELAAELVNLKVDVILAGLSISIAGAQGATSNIPIVMVLASDPVASGFVASLAKPGGNITGLSNLNREWVPKQLELLSIARPNLRRVGAIFDPGTNVGFDPLPPLEAAGRQLNIAIVPFRATSTDRIEETFDAISRAEMQGLMVLTGVFFGSRERIGQLALAHRLAWVSSTREEVVAGALLSYGQNVRASFSQSAAYVDRIMKGASPAELPVQQPTKFDIVINLKTAKALGIEFPLTLLARADEVIE